MILHQRSTVTGPVTATKKCGSWFLYPAGRFNVVARARYAEADDNFQRASIAAKDAASSARDAASAAADAVRNLKVPDMAMLDVDIHKTLRWNFLAQLALTAVSWAIAFFTSHTALAKGTGVHPTTVLLMAGVVLSGWSTYLSYTYITKVKGGGLDIIQGWSQLKAFNEHLVVNFAGAAATILALQAEVGLIMVGGITKAGGDVGVSALAQASTNTLLAHLVSIVFLTFMIRKITAAYQKILEWGEYLTQSMPRL